MRCTLEFETGNVAVDPDALRATDSAEPLVSLALRVSEEALERMHRFVAAAEPDHLRAILVKVAEGLTTMRDRDAEGFTICPLVTRAIRVDRVGVRSGVDVDVAACVAILTFRESSAPADAPWLTAHQALCRSYYRDVLSVFVERRLGEALSGRSFEYPWKAEAAAAAALGECLEELRTRMPLHPFQTRCEEYLRLSGNPEDVLRRIQGWLRAEASRRLGL